MPKLLDMCILQDSGHPFLATIRMLERVLLEQANNS